MSNKVSTCLHIDKGVLETARQVDLNLSKVAENALVEAIGKLAGTEPATRLKSQPPVSFENRGWGWDLNPGARLHRPGDCDSEAVFAKFCDFCRVDLSLADATAKEYRCKTRRFLEARADERPMLELNSGCCPSVSARF